MPQPTSPLSPTELAAAAREADHRIRPHVRETPVDRSPALEAGDCTVFLKLENLQHTGSFKLRGVVNTLLSLSEGERARGVVAASSGNHGAALAYALGVLGARGTVFVPEDAAASKIDAIRRYGAEVRIEGEDCVLTEHLARQHAAATGAVYVSPYNDARVVAGQGTVGVELDRQLDPLDAVFVALGGGGLSSGLAAALKDRRPDVEVIACSPENSRVMHESIRAGRVLDLPSKPTLSDGTAGGVEADTITFDLCRQLIDRYTLVSEDAIVQAMRRVIGEQHLLIEGAAGVAVAAFLQESDRWRGKTVAIVLCGANIGLGTLRQVLR